MKPLLAADLFCGAGGTSTGLLRAAALLGRRIELVAVNHWDVAVSTHAANHPTAGHFCEDLTTLDPRRAVPSGRLDLLMASPECTHHSNARGGRPMSDQSRASAWCVLRWATALRIDRILVENVPEFQTWGPLGVMGRPLVTRRGETFHAWIESLRSLGYAVEWRVLNAADYGDATTRRRLFIQAAMGRRQIRWPDATHSADGSPDLFGQRARWRAAREVIDWSLPSRSIFGRKRQLKPRTLARIAAGLRRFSGEAFVTAVTHHGNNRISATTRPLPTVTGANRGEHALIQPFLVPYYGTSRPDSVDEPMATLTAKDRLGLVQAFLIGQQSGAAARSISLPAPTIATAGAISLVQPHPHEMDIHFRMLQPHELAGAMGFPAGYRFAGSKGDQVRQIGNAVPVGIATALTAAMLA